MRRNARGSDNSHATAQRAPLAETPGARLPAGRVDVKGPKLRNGSDFPEFPEPGGEGHGCGYPGGLLDTLGGRPGPGSAMAGIALR